MVKKEIRKEGGWLG